MLHYIIDYMNFDVHLEKHLLLIEKLREARYEL